MTKKDTYFQYIRTLSSIENALDICIADVSVDVQNVCDGTGLKHNDWQNDANHENWDNMRVSAEMAAEKRLNDADYNALIIKQFSNLDKQNTNLIAKVNSFINSGYVDVTVSIDCSIIYDVNPDYYIIIDGDVTADGKHTIVSSFKLKDGKMVVYDIYNEIHEIVGDVDIFNVAKILA